MHDGGSTITPDVEEMPLWDEHFKMAVFWNTAPCSQGDSPDDGGS
jgi:hypothetical protein